MANFNRFARPLWLFLAAGATYSVFLGIQLGRSYLSAMKDADRIRHIVASEELILSLNDEIGRLSRSVQNLALPDEDAAYLFADNVSLVDTDSSAKPELAAKHGPAADPLPWQLGEATRVPKDRLQLWKTLLNRVSFFEHARFYLVNGTFTNNSLNEFITHVNFKGRAQLRSGEIAGIQAKQTITWRKAGSDTEPVWQISGWQTEKVETIEALKPLFAEVLDQALPNPDDLSRARTSLHEQAVLQFYASGGREVPWRYFTPISANQRPGISVVDVDQDGFDDLYIATRRGPNLLFRNRGNGTFEEVAREWGVDIGDYCSCSIFADFDNDGDPDLILGRTIERSMYFENTGQRFVNRSVSELPHTLPHLVVSMSAADYNRDGLLDVYFCTYRPAVLESIVTDEQAEQTPETPESTADQAGLDGIAKQARDWPDEFLTAEQARTFSRLASSIQNRDEAFGKILDQVGPPNILLVNRGRGRFEIAPESSQLALWRNTLQATWADFDEDGDPDLYVANDWSTDNLFRNDGAAGFRDVTQELGTTEFGFGMGVTWGDYDRDGWQDIYVSNMYSKAGRRITAQIKELNPSYNRSVDGNYLYRHTPDGFKLVSGLEPPGIPVAEAGWSWGGQFADLDNDGFLDLYVLSGYFSAPPRFASNIDL